ncbi:GIY-YIG nuclease family protein [Novosphingobium beihaiensis]|nr:GIY-YIG nuclease family protein [Novosphingobium beihaiensis]
MEAILSEIRQQLPAALTVDAATVETVWGEPGAYVLLMDLESPVRFARKGIAATSLSGWLVYAGSARGRGGIGARLRRHFRQDKKVHWHADELTNTAARLSALAIPEGAECSIVARLTASGRFETALAGFGSSDCRCCQAHLLRPQGALIEATGSRSDERKRPRAQNY